MTEAREHALIASQYLVNLDTFAEKLRGMDAEQRLHMFATGGIKQANADQEYTLQVATAHALAAIALALTEDET